MSYPTMRRGWQADQRGPRYVPTTNGPKIVGPLAKRRRTSERTAQKACDEFRQMVKDIAAEVAADPSLAGWAFDALLPLNAVLCPEATDDLAAHRHAYLTADADSDVLVAEYLAEPTPERENKAIAAVKREAARGVEFVHALLRRRTMRVVR